MHAIIFHCVWETKSLHTISSYIFTSSSNVMIFVNTLSHWFLKLSNNMYGYVPPTLEDTKTKPDLVHLIVKSLFFHKTQKKSLCGFLLLLFWYFIKHYLYCLVSTNIQQIIPLIRTLFPLFKKQNFQWILFANDKMKSLQVLTKIIGWRLMFQTFATVLQKDMSIVGALLG